MKTTVITIAQMVSLAVIALALGLGVNTVRGKNQVHLARDYKPKPAPITTTGTRGGNSPASAASDPSPSTGQKPPDAAPDPAAEFQLVTLDEVRALQADPKTTNGSYVFVDARKDDAYEAGHIPGAIQCDYWRLDTYLETVLPRVLGAEKVIVYCNGKQCEDSLELCRTFTQTAQVPWGSVYLFKGGWEAWSAAKLPVETGREDKP
jgi:rhodanese-related sulfurtransferase